MCLTEQINCDRQSLRDKAKGEEMERGSIGQLNNDDRGISLVEIIISILILMIVFVPLINSMLTANKVNSAASKEFYAAQAADNVMTEICYLGYNTVIALCRDDSQLTGAENYSYSNGKYHYSNTPGGTYREGTGSFLVSFTVTKEGYDAQTGTYNDGSVNSYTFADTADFALPTTAQIIPGEDTSDHLDDAYSYFAGRYQQHQQSVLTGKLEELEAKLLAGQIEDDAYEDQFQLLLDTYDFSIDRARFERQIVKGRKIIIVPKDGDDTRPYEIRYTESYEFVNSAEDYMLSDDPDERIARDFPDYTKNIENTTGSEQSVYLLYTPASAHLADDEITIYNGVRPSAGAGGKPQNLISVFVVLQNAQGIAWNSNDTLHINLPAYNPATGMTCYNGNLSINCQAALEFETGSGYFNTVYATSNTRAVSDRLIKETQRQEERIYYVELTVEDPDDPGTPLATLRSTMTE